MSVNSEAIFLTGATGFIGKRLAARLDREGLELRLLVRGDRPSAGAGGGRSAVLVRGALEDPASYAEALRGCNTVVHLAARTGKARPAEYFRVNAEGTSRLLDECRRAGVSRFLYVSSIAAGYADKRAYPYARSKERAEDAVRASGLRYLILRPTIVLGAGSPAWRGLAALAGAPVIPVFGDGRSRVQPVDVDDLAGCLQELLEEDHFTGEVIEVGGRDVLAIEDLLSRIHRALRGREPRVVRLPARITVSLLAAAEIVLLPWMPLTAGQLSVFLNDSAAKPHPFMKGRLSRMKGVAEMIECANRGE
jgi:NADH dehydrogenase